ncbi:HU family DNA-binding protein [Planktotalea sp.]|uniref:HU family DNA-binding protein n=1 Tax=Planktotalea sp. TaxID=2029877 RepID=UPI003D6A22CE
MGTKTTTTQLIDAIAAKNGLSKENTKDVVGSLFTEIGAQLASGNEVAINHFGTFKPRQNAARTGRNPRTGETVQIGASVSAAFKQSKTLKDKVNA